MTDVDNVDLMLGANEEPDDETELLVDDDGDYIEPEAVELEPTFGGVPLSVISSVKKFGSTGDHPDVQAFIQAYKRYVDQYPEAYRFELYRQKPMVDEKGNQITGFVMKLDQLDHITDEYIADLNLRPPYGSFDIIFRGPNGRNTGAILTRLNGIKIAPHDRNPFAEVGARARANTPNPLQPAADGKNDATVAAFQQVFSGLSDTNQKLMETLFNENSKRLESILGELGSKLAEKPKSDDGTSKQIFDLFKTQLSAGPAQDSTQVKTLIDQLDKLRADMSQQRRDHADEMAKLRNDEAMARNRLIEEYNGKLADAREDRAKLREEYLEKMRDNDAAHHREIERMRESNGQSRDAAIEAKQAKIDGLERENADLKTTASELRQKIETLQSELRQTEQRLTDARIEAKTKKGGDMGELEGLAKGITALKAVSSELGFGGGGESGGGWVEAVKALGPVAQGAFGTLSEALRVRAAAGGMPMPGGYAPNPADDRAAWEAHRRQNGAVDSVPAPAPGTEETQDEEDDEPMPLGEPTPPEPTPEEQAAIVDKIVQVVIEETEEAADLELTTTQYFERLLLVTGLGAQLKLPELKALLVQVPNEQVYLHFGVDPQSLSSKARAYFEARLNELRGVPAPSAPEFSL